MYRTLLLLLCISTSIASEQFCCKDGIDGSKTTFSKDDKTTSDFWGSQYAPHTPDMAEAFCRELHANNAHLKISQFFYRGACDAPVMPPHNYPPGQTLLMQGSQFPIVPARKDDGSYCHEGAECNVATKSCYFTKNSIKCAWHRNQCATVDVCGAEPVCWEIYNKWKDYNVNDWDCLNKDNCAGTFREHGACCEAFTHTCYACKMCLTEDDYCKLSVQVREEPGLGVPPGCYCPSGTVSIAGDSFSPCNNCQAGWGNGAGGNTPCSPCPAGTANPIEAGVCVECPYPKLSAAGALECVDATVLHCAEGQKFTPPTTTIDGSCAHCPAGTYGPEEDANGETAQTYCTTCPHGSYSETQGLIECTVCPDDQTTTTGSPGVGSTLASDCTDCASDEDCRVRTTENDYTCRRERAVAGACETTRSVIDQGLQFVPAEDGGREVDIDQCEADASTWNLNYCSIQEGGREANPVSCTAPASTWNNGFCNLLGARNANKESCEMTGLSWEFSSSLGYYCTKADDLSFHATQFTSPEECEGGGATWNEHFGVCSDDRDIAPCTESSNGVWQPDYCTAAAIDAYEVMDEKGYCNDGFVDDPFAGYNVGHNEHSYYSGRWGGDAGLSLEDCFDVCLQGGQFDYFIHHSHTSAIGAGNCYCGDTKERDECEDWWSAHYYSYRIQRASNVSKLGYTTRTACETQGTWEDAYCTNSDYTTWEACETKGRWTGNEENLGCRSTTAPKDDTGKNWCYIADVDHEAAGQNWDYCTVACPPGEEPVLNADTGSAWYECAACADGKKNNEYDDSACDVCGNGEFTDDKTTCTACTNTGAVTWANTLTGHITNAACQVTKCEAGYKLENHKCTACEAGEHSAAGDTDCTADSADQNSCTASQHFVEGTDHTTDDAECADDSTQQEDCIAGEYFVAGTASSTEDDSSCADCEGNQYSAAGAASCTNDGKAQASDCGNDQYFTVGTSKTEDDGTCSDCAEPSAQQYTTTVCGSGATDRTADTAIGDCSAPGTGQYTSTVCDHGDSATVGANTQFTSCSSCTAGQYASVACAAGTKVLEGSDTTCSNCEAGTSSDAGATTCTNCAAGKTSTSGNACSDCGANQYSAAGDASCTNCDAGQYSTAGSSSCSNCAGGSTSTAGSACSNCAAGTYAASGDASCTACENGKYSAAGASSCTAHTSCHANRLSGASATAAGTCPACSSGWAAQDTDDCQTHSTSCESGKYISAAGSPTADITCTACATCSGTKYASGGCTGSTNTICTERCSDGTSYATEAACLAAAGSCNDNSVTTASACTGNYVTGGTCSDTNRGASESQCTITTDDTGSPLSSSDANYLTKATCQTLRDAWQNPQTGDPTFEQSHQAAPAGCYTYYDSSSDRTFVEWNNQGGVGCGHNNIDCIKHTGNTWTDTTSARSWTSSNSYHSG